MYQAKQKASETSQLLNAFLRAKWRRINQQIKMKV